MAGVMKMKVKFVKPVYPDGSTEILALFVNETRILYSPMGFKRSVMTCFSQQSQHHVCDMSLLRATKAKPEDYNDLNKELEKLGYLVEIA